jgi:hypothetical protein
MQELKNQGKKNHEEEIEENIYQWVKWEGPGIGKHYGTKYQWYTGT